MGREVYVTVKNIGAGTVDVSQPLYGAAGMRTYTFRRFKYMLDFSGFSLLSRFEIEDVEFNCTGRRVGVHAAAWPGTPSGSCPAPSTGRRTGASASTGAGCQGMFVDMCQFLSNEQSLAAVDRTTIALNVQANDVKLRNNRIVRFAHFAVMNGSGHLIHANHFFQGDDAAAGVRRGGAGLHPDQRLDRGDRQLHRQLLHRMGQRA